MPILRNLQRVVDLCQTIFAEGDWDMLSVGLACVEGLTDQLEWDTVERFNVDPPVESLQVSLLRFLMRVLNSEERVQVSLRVRCASIFGSNCSFHWRRSISVEQTLFEEPLHELMGARESALIWLNGGTVATQELAFDMIVRTTIGCKRVLAVAHEGHWDSGELSSLVNEGAGRVKDSLLALVLGLDAEDALARTAALSLLKCGVDDCKGTLQTLARHYIEDTNPQFCSPSVVTMLSACIHESSAEDKLDLMVYCVPFLEQFLLVRDPDEAGDAFADVCNILCDDDEYDGVYEYKGTIAVRDRLVVLLDRRLENGKEESYYKSVLLLLVTVVKQTVESVDAHVVSVLVTHLLQTLRSEDNWKLSKVCYEVAILLTQLVHCGWANHVGQELCEDGNMSSLVNLLDWDHFYSTRETQVLTLLSDLAAEACVFRDAVLETGVLLRIDDMFPHRDHDTTSFEYSTGNLAVIAELLYHLSVGGIGPPGSLTLDRLRTLLRLRRICSGDDFVCYGFQAMTVDAVRAELLSCGSITFLSDIFKSDFELVQRTVTQANITDLTSTKPRDVAVRFGGKRETIQQAIDGGGINILIDAIDLDSTGPNVGRLYLPLEMTSIVNVLIGGSTSQVALILSDNRVVAAISRYLLPNTSQESIEKILFAILRVAALAPIAGRSKTCFHPLRVPLMSNFCALLYSMGSKTKGPLVRMTLQTMSMCCTPRVKHEVADCTRCIEQIVAALVDKISTHAVAGNDHPIPKVILQALALLSNIYKKFDFKPVYSDVLVQLLCNALPFLTPAMKVGLPDEPDPAYLSASVQCVLGVLRMASWHSPASLDRARLIFTAANGPRKLAYLILFGVEIDRLQLYTSILRRVGIYTRLVNSLGVVTEGVFVGEVVANGKFGQGVEYQFVDTKKRSLVAYEHVYTADSSDNCHKLAHKAVSIPFSTV